MTEKKTYWLLENLWIEFEETYLGFEQENAALEYASEHGAFDSCHGKEDWCAQYDKIIFPILESEVEHFNPIKFMR